MDFHIFSVLLCYTYFFPLHLDVVLVTNFFPPSLSCTLVFFSFEDITAELVHSLESPYRQCAEIVWVTWLQWLEVVSGIIKSIILCWLEFKFFLVSIVSFVSNSFKKKTGLFCTDLVCSSVLFFNHQVTSVNFSLPQPQKRMFSYSFFFLMDFSHAVLRLDFACLPSFLPSFSSLPFFL